MPLAILCSGQGGQHAEMFASLAAVEAAGPALEKVSELTGLAIGDGPLAADPEALAANRMAQILVVGHALAAHAALSAEGVEAAVFSGYSAGEIAAHGCSGALDAMATLDLVAERGEAMDIACAGTPQGMLATIGLKLSEAEELAAATGVAVAIVNGPDHVVAGGPVDALDRYGAEASLRARHVRRLSVRVASHTPLLAAAGPRFAAAVEASQWRAPASPILSGLDGRAIRDKVSAADLLSRQLHERLDWMRCLESIFEYGATAVLEIGPGRALTRMIEESFPGVAARAFEDFRTPAGAAAWARRQA